MKSTLIEPGSMAQNIQSTLAKTYPNRVFDLEQNSAEKDLIIGKQDIRISNLEKENSDKDSKISELQVNLGGLTDVFFDLKQLLFQKSGDEFQPLSVEGEKITSSSSGPSDPTSQSSNEITARTTLDANLDSFLSSASLSSQERRERSKLRETGMMFTEKYGDRSGIFMWGIRC
ncbi:unnamed protein product [Lactuca saligna]|uniref:Uncharacterized protein n=1 Tax=Lactuca saligna TaxID=75948 RepID=A0AA36E0L1_LACSI|nr:unnamed protein product [Lactuca saligna]